MEIPIRNESMTLQKIFVGRTVLVKCIIKSNHSICKYHFPKKCIFPKLCTFYTNKIGPGKFNHARTVMNTAFYLSKARIEMLRKRELLFHKICDGNPGFTESFKPFRKKSAFLEFLQYIRPFSYHNHGSISAFFRIFD